VIFVGSPAVGKLVMRAASATLKPVILELGGKVTALSSNGSPGARRQGAAHAGKSVL
jgi:acyl-CoA reductase-like NAD-dependent aldehyde dehydrogenase